MTWDVELLLGGPAGNALLPARGGGDWQGCRAWINFQEPRFRAGNLVIFVVSIHSIGYGLTGVMAATSFVRFDFPSPPASDDAYEGAGERVERDSKVCSDEPFLLTVADKADVAKLESRFEAWVTNGLSVALRGWLEIVVEQA